MDEEGNIGAVSARDLSIIVPPGPYRIGVVTPSAKYLERTGVYIFSENPETDETKMIGFYSVDGVSYWKD